MYGSCWLTRPAVLEDEDGSGVASVESRYTESLWKASKECKLVGTHGYGILYILW
jgi:hypothetical protein